MDLLMLEMYEMIQGGSALKNCDVSQHTVDIYLKKLCRTIDMIDDATIVNSGIDLELKKTLFEIKTKLAELELQYLYGKI